MKTFSLKRFFLVLMLAGLSTGALAEDAPVYDVDSYPPQFDGNSRPAQQPPLPTNDMGPQAGPQASPGFVPPSPSTQSMTMEQRVARLEQQTNNVVSSDMPAKISDLQTQVQTLRGQVEDLTHQLQQMQAQQKTMYSDLDKRVSSRSTTTATTPEADPGIADTGTDSSSAKKKKAKAVAAAAAIGDEDIDTIAAGKAADQASANDLAAAPPKTDDQPNVAEEQQIYQSAYSLIKAKKYNEAAATLQKMLQKYPSGQFAANAHYWLGELYGLMGKNDQAITEFGTVVKNYPDSPKLADAQLKLGLIYATQQKWSDAKSSFKKVINHYPGTSSAHLAAEQLKQIKAAGH
jgi:tol-pal system protein YbgF